MTEHVKERLVDLLIDDLKIWQRPDEFCFSLDTVILTYFATVHSKRKYIDLGTGTAAIPLLLTSRGAGTVTAVEINPIMADLARRNVKMNEREHRITVVEGDYRDRTLLAAEAFDGVIVNPPYFSVGSGRVATGLGRAMARHETVTALDDVLESAYRLVKFHGHVWLIYRAERLAELLVGMERYRLTPKRLRMIHSLVGRPAKLVVVEGRKGAAAGMEVEPPLYVYETSGVYSEEVMSWYGGKEWHTVSCANTHR